MWMWIGIGIAALAVVFLVLVGYWQTRRSDDLDDIAVPNQLIVRFKDDVEPAVIEEIHRKHRCEVMDGLEDAGFQVIRSKRKTQWMMEKYMNLPEIEYAEPDYKVKAFYTPNDPFFPGYQYGPQRVGAPAAWEVSQSSSNIIIAIVDSGIELSHPDLAGKLLQGYDFVDGDAVPADSNGHGTHVAGIAAAITNNARGIAGMAPFASILPVRVLDHNGNGSMSTVASGIIYAANRGAQVINLSLGSPYDTSTLQYAVSYAWSRGSVLVAAAGNDGLPTPNYPANYPNVLAVAATDAYDFKTPFSNFGTWVDVAAPGASILSTYLGGNYAYLDGTSMAAPHVSGIAALLAAQGRSNTQVHDIIRTTSDPVLYTGIFWIFGRVNADRAVRS